MMAMVPIKRMGWDQAESVLGQIMSVGDVESRTVNTERNECEARKKIRPSRRTTATSVGRYTDVATRWGEER